MTAAEHNAFPKGRGDDNSTTRRDLFAGFKIRFRSAINNSQHVIRVRSLMESIKSKQ